MIGLCRGAVLLVFLLLGFSGCASVHVDVNRDLDWAKVKALALQEPAEDRWKLAPLIVTELQQQGFSVVRGSQSDADLLLRYQTAEKPDLDAEGNVSERLESVHLQFLDPVTGKRQAVIDYFYPTSDSSHTVAAGIVEALAGLRNAQPGSLTATRPREPVATQQPQAAAPIKQVGDADTAQELAQQTSSPPPAAQQDGPKTAATAVTDVNEANAEEAAIEEPQPLTRSPWIPRFHSWGFDNWGEDEQNDTGY